MAEIGAVINKAYRITEKIDGSETSGFYLAKDIKNKKSRYAVKEIRKTDDQANQLYINSAIREANAIKENGFPAFPRIVDVCDEEDALYLVREYIDGKTLEEVVKKEGPRPEEKVTEWALELCDALAYLHNLPQPIIYRSLKPSKIIINPDGKLMLLNYDMARDIDPEQANRAAAADKNGFMAPEQLFGQSDERSDIYALGATLRCLLTGVFPVVGEDVSYDAVYEEKKISKNMIRVIDRCTSYYADERFQSCEELRAAITGERVARFEDDMPDRRRTVGIILKTAAVILVVGALIAAYFIFGNSSASPNGSPDATYTQLTTVPKVVGKTYEDAKQVLIIAGLQCERVDAYHPKVKRGIVYSQDIKPNQALEKGAVVKLKVSLGPQPTEPPPPPTETEPAPTEAYRSSRSSSSASSYSYSDDSDDNSADSAASQAEAPDNANSTPAPDNANSAPAPDNANSTPAPDNNSGNNNTPSPDNNSGGANSTPAPDNNGGASSQAEPDNSSSSGE